MATTLTDAQLGQLDAYWRAANYLSGDDDIITIKARQSAAGNLNKIADPIKAAGAMLISRTLNVIIIPVLVLIALFLVLILRGHTLKAQDAAAMGGRYAPPDKTPAPTDDKTPAPDTGAPTDTSAPADVAPSTEE
jgi:hypothetical protein